jgi:hypothetical protein
MYDFDVRDGRRVWWGERHELDLWSDEEPDAPDDDGADNRPDDTGD